MHTLKNTNTPTGKSTVTSVTVAGGSTVSEVVVIPASASSAAASPGLHQSNNSDGSSMPPAGTIAGGVVGGAAGLAVILLVVMVLMRWYKRRSQQNHQALPPPSAASPEPYNHNPSVSSGPGMAERAGIRPLAGAIPGFLRTGTMSESSSDPSTAVTASRGFHRVSGRKLPSAFSEGMSSDAAYPASTMSAYAPAAAAAAASAGAGAGAAGMAGAGRRPSNRPRPDMPLTATRSAGSNRSGGSNRSNNGNNGYRGVGYSDNPTNFSSPFYSDDPYYGGGGQSESFESGNAFGSSPIDYEDERNYFMDEPHQQQQQQMMASRSHPTLSPGPQRRPTFNTAGGPYVQPSGVRGRFTEEV